MMYKSLTRKVFWLFFPLAVISIIFGSFVYYGQSTIQQSNAKINLAKDFQLQLKQLETMHPHSIHLGAGGNRKNFEEEIKKTEEKANRLVLIHSDISSELRERLKKIPFFMENFSRAYRELFNLFVLDAKFPKKNARLLKILHKESETHGVDKNLDNTYLIHNLFQEMMILQVGIYHNRKMTTLPELKKIIIRIKSNSTNPKIHALSQEFIDNIEANYINYLEIRNREAFLKNTADQFFQIASDTIEAVKQESNKTQALFIWIIFCFTLAVIFVNLISWLWSSRYIRRFLKNQHHAMAALENRNYDFTLPSVPKDEIGDLTLAMQTLASNFKESLIQLKDSEKKYRELVDNLSDWVWEVDEKGRYTYASKAIKELLGYSSSEIIGISPFDLMPDNEATRIKRIFSEYINEKQSFSALKNINLHKDGHEVILETSAQPIIDENGILRGYRGIDRDITDRELAVQEQARLEEQLYQAQKMESIGRLAGGVAHDFNNILSAINGYAELSLIKMDPDNPYRKDMSTILESGQRAARLTQQLLAFSRKQIIKQEQLNINNELKEINKMLRRLLGEDIEIETYYSEDIWPVKTDRSQLEQVIINLAVNARDAMPHGGKLTIETTNVTLDESYIKKYYDMKAGDYVMLAITDNGQGMAKEVMEHIFEPFYTTKDMTKGTGLGLATVHGIIKQNGGEINVYSEPEKGTTFKIYLPRAGGNNNKKDLLPAPSSHAPHGTETILLVEDDELVRNLSFDILTNQGYTVLVAQDGLEALDMCQGYQGHINLLLTDVVMPKMSGTELAEKITKFYPVIHILFMSGYTENAIVQNGILKSGVNFVHKPITPQILSLTVRKILDS
jgi:PAS domain S-box-containing protein